MKIEWLKLDFCASKYERNEKRRVRFQKTVFGAERNRLQAFYFFIPIFK